jgi:hypothetical protein
MNKPTMIARVLAAKGKKILCNNIKEVKSREKAKLIKVEFYNNFLVSLFELGIY